MNTPSGPIIASAVLLTGAVAAGAMLIGCQTPRRGGGHDERDWTYLQVRRFTRFISNETEKSGLPEGGVAVLEVWLNEQCKDEIVFAMVNPMFIYAPAAIVRVSEDGRLRLVDTWGRAIVYRYRTDAPGRLFRLYSVGPNGVDEDGKGDDIDGSPASPTSSSQSVGSVVAAAESRFLPGWILCTMRPGT